MKLQPIYQARCAISAQESPGPESFLPQQGPLTPALLQRRLPPTLIPATRERPCFGDVLVDNLLSGSRIMHVRSASVSVDPRKEMSLALPGRIRLLSHGSFYFKEFSNARWVGVDR